MQNNNQTNQFIQWIVTIGDFLLLNVIILVATRYYWRVETWPERSLQIFILVNNVALVLTAINIYPVLSDPSVLSSVANPDYMQAFLENGQYWHVIIYSGCVAGCLLPIGNLAGYELMKVEDMTISWYARHIMPKVFVGWLAGLGIYFLVDLWLR